MPGLENVTYLLTFLDHRLYSPVGSTSNAVGRNGHFDLMVLVAIFSSKYSINPIVIKYRSLNRCVPALFPLALQQQYTLIEECWFSLVYLEIKTYFFGVAQTKFHNLSGFSLPLANGFILHKPVKEIMFHKVLLLLSLSGISSHIIYGIWYFFQLWLLNDGVVDLCFRFSTLIRLRSFLPNIF